MADRIGERVGGAGQWERRVASEGSTMRLETLEGDVLANRFRLERMIGKGGYGAVFEATQLSVGRRCAVKIMLPARSTSEAVEKRFRDEARATSRLTHPNSLVLYDFGVDEKTGFLFLATEFLDGCTLHDVLQKQKTIEVRRAVSIMTQVAASLQDAHSLGLVHRDIKPKNIMLIERAGTKDFVKVIDFGIAKAMRGQLCRETALTRTGMMIGTPQYMAPEQILGRQLDGRADQYVLAVVGYRMLTGRNPFRSGAPMETAMRHVNDRVLPLRTYRPELQVTAEFEDAFLRALEKSPEYRFDRVVDFVEALEAGLDERLLDDDVVADPEMQKATIKVSVPGETQSVAMPKEEQVTTGPTKLALAVTGRTTEKLGAVLQARAGREGTAGAAIAEIDEKERITARVKRDKSLEDQKPVVEDERTGDVEGREGEKIEVKQSAEEKTREQPGSIREEVSTEQLYDVRPIRALTRLRKSPTWILVLASISLVTFFFVMAAVVILVGLEEESQEELASSLEAVESAEKEAKEVGHIKEEGPDDDGVLAQLEEGKRRVADARQEASTKAVMKAEKLEASAKKEAEAVPRRPATGTVTVTMIPWGTLYVDGEEISDRTRQKVELPQGRSELTLRQRGKVRAREVVDVQGGDSKMVVLEAEFDTPN